MTGATKKVYFTQGHGEKDTASSRPDGLQRHQRRRWAPTTTASTSWCWRRRSDVPADATVVVVAGPRTDFLQPEIDALKKYVAQGRQGAGAARSAGQSRRSGAAAPGRLPAASGASTSARDVVLDASGIGQLLGTDASVPVGGQLSGAPDHRGLPADDGVSAGAIDRRRSKAASTGARAQPIVADQPAELGRDRLRRASASATAASSSTPTRATGRARSRSARRSRRPRPKRRRRPQATPSPPAHADAAEAGIAHRRRSATPTSPTNAALGVQGNRDFFLNTVNWLAQQENLIAIRPREPDDRRLTLTADQQQLHHAAVDLHHSRPGLRGRHLRLVAEE